MAATWAARVFFVWLSVFNLFVLFVFWSFMVDVFDHAQAARLFGTIAAGSSAGAILGPALTATLVGRIDPTSLLPLSAAVLALTLPCVAGLARWGRRHGSGGSEPAGRQRALAGSRYLLGICAFIWLYTTLATFLYFQQANIIEAAIADSGERTTVFALIDLATNSLTIVLQLFVTARLVQYFGLARALAFVPAVLALGFLALAAAPALLTIASVQVIRYTSNYAIARPGREMLFTVVSRMEKYKAKNLIETVIYRGGDAIAGWLFSGLTAWGVGLRGVALLAVPLAGIWLMIGWWLGQRQADRVRRHTGAIAHDETAYTGPL